MRLTLFLISALALAVAAACTSGTQYVPPSATPPQGLITQTVSTPTATGEASTAQSFILEISSPQNESVVTTPSITVRGRSTPDAVVSVNGQLEELDANGAFESFISLEPGPNTIEVVANDFNGGQNSRLLTVIYVP